MYILLLFPWDLEPRKHAARAFLAPSEMGTLPKLPAIFCRSRVQRGQTSSPAANSHKYLLRVKTICKYPDACSFWHALCRNVYETDRFAIARRRLGPNVEVVIVGRCIYQNNGELSKIESSSCHIFGIEVPPITSSSCFINIALKQQRIARKRQNSIYLSRFTFV